MQYGLLGPVEVRTDRGEIAVGGDRTRSVLAALLLNANRMVPVHELIEATWGERPPATARAQVQNRVSGLRRLLRDAADGADPLTPRGSGYLFRVAEGQLDVHRVDAAVSRAEELAGEGQPAAAAALLDDALALWRGPALDGLDSPQLRAAAEHLETRRLAILERRIELQLDLGRHAEVVSELDGLVATHPLRERLRGLLMMALSGSGRRAEALDVFHRGRRLLIEQLGVEPGPELRRLHERILRGDRLPDGPSAGPPSPAAPTAPPRAVEPVRWLPRTVTDFTGRRELVANLLAAVDRADPTAPVVQVIDGMAGSGKTTLAVHLAYRLATRYPDAQLYIDLRGHGEGSPVDPATALATLLGQLGVTAGRVPADLADRVALWRSELAGRRSIVVLDNAAGSEQLNPLLPTAPGCVVLVTSRRRLLALDGGQPWSLPVLGPDEAVELLARAAGPGRVHAEPDAAAEVARRCGYLPLAIRLAGARLAHRPGWRVADIAGRLRQESRVIAELAGEDRTVARAFAGSYEHLREPVQRTFRRLGLFPGGQLNIAAVAALSDLDADEAQDVIDELVDRHLVEEPAPGRYRLHDLMREYARGLATATDAPADRRDATERLLDHYVHAVATATRPLESVGARRQVSLPEARRPDLLPSAEAALDWLIDERMNVRALVRMAAEEGHHRWAWLLARVTWRFQYPRCYHDDILDTHAWGLDSAKRLGDEAAVATMHNYIASAYTMTGRFPEALTHLEEAVRLRDRIGDRFGALASQSNLAVVHWLSGRPTEAVEINRHALRERVRLGYDFAEVLANLGLSLTTLGRYDEALRVHRRHLLLCCDRKDDRHRAVALGHIGAVRVRLGHHDAGIRLIEASIALRQRTGNRSGEAELLNDLGLAHRGLGRLDLAEQRHRTALHRAVDAGERHVQSAALNDLGLTVRAAGRRPEAVAAHEEALAVATRINQPYEQARALDGLAACSVADDPDRASRYWTRALALFQRMGVPERHRVERRLADLDR